MVKPLIARIERGHVVVDRLDGDKSKPTKKYFIDDDFDDDGYCVACLGTGEGMAPDSACSECKGSGFIDS